MKGIDKEERKWFLITRLKVYNQKIKIMIMREKKKRKNIEKVIMEKRKREREMKGLCEKQTKKKQIKG